MRPTLVFIRHCEIDGRAFTHGSELEPDILSQDQVDKLLDAGFLKECPERRSLYRLFPAFSGCKQREHLSEEELDALALPSIKSRI